MEIIDKLNNALTPKAQKNAQVEASVAVAEVDSMREQIVSQPENNEVYTDTAGRDRQLRIGTLENVDLGVFKGIDPVAYSGLFRVGNQEADVAISGRMLHAYAGRMYPADKVTYNPWIGGIGVGGCEGGHVSKAFLFDYNGEEIFSPFVSKMEQKGMNVMVVGVVIKVNTSDKFLGNNKLRVRSGAVESTFILKDSNVTGVVSLLITKPRMNVRIGGEETAEHVTFSASYAERDQSYLVGVCERQRETFLTIEADNLYVEVHPVFGTSTIAAMWDQAIFEGDPTRLAASYLTLF